MKINQIIYEQVCVSVFVFMFACVIHCVRVNVCVCVLRCVYSYVCVCVCVSVQACRLLSDDYEQVRSAAVQMVWVLSQLYPER